MSTNELSVNYALEMGRQRRQATTTIGRPSGGGRSAKQNRDHILDAAQQCFARAGVADTTVAQIATEAGLSRSLVYRHFDGRDAIVLACLERAGEQFMADAAITFEESETLADLLTNSIADIVLRARTDPILGLAFNADDRPHVSQLLANSTTILDRATAVGELILLNAPQFRRDLRPGLTVPQVMEHCRLFGLMLVTAPEHVAGTRESLTTYIRTFLIPAIVTD